MVRSFSVGAGFPQCRSARRRKNLLGLLWFEKTLFAPASHYLPSAMPPSAGPDLSSADGSLRARARATGQSLVGALVEYLSQALTAGAPADPSVPLGRHTLLAVCPTSEAVTRAALVAAQRVQAPLLFAATLNQVDRDGGYTGWTPHDFAAFVEREADRIGVDVPIVLGLDHGGPWRKDAHAQQDLDYTATMEAVKTSLEACIDAGYELLHLDPTEDRRLPESQPVPIGDIVDRTVELMQYAETVRQDRERGPIAYEVGTEEVGGGLQSEERFSAFLRLLSDALSAEDLPEPMFVVGDVGTKLDTAHFNATRARTLTAEAQSQVGALLKGHYTDDVDALEAYPLSGMGGANVGPGLAAVERDALRELVDLERQVLREPGQRSGFPHALRDAVVSSGRWRKWLRPEEEGAPFRALPDDRQQWLVGTGSRYVWTDPAVEAARDDLYANVSPYRDADAFVQWRLETEITRYLHAFNLVGLAPELKTWMGEAL